MARRRGAVPPAGPTPARSARSSNGSKGRASRSQCGEPGVVVLRRTGVERTSGRGMEARGREEG